MHYPSNAFSINGSATIIPIQQGVQIGQRVTLSQLDIQAVRRFYNCSGPGGSTTTLATTTTTTGHNDIYNQHDNIHHQQY